MTRIYKKTKNFLLYSIVFGAALSVSSFLANMLAARSMTQGRVSTSPIPFTPVASADFPHTTSDAGSPGSPEGLGGGGDGSGAGAGCGSDGAASDGGCSP